MEDASAPAAIDPATGQHRDHWVLSAEQRAKGFVRPVRDSYQHVGQRPQYPVRELTAAEKALHPSYAAYEAYPEGDSVVGRFWTQAQLDSGCGTVTTMGRAIAETYAREPSFYGSTFCVECRGYFPVSEFVWDGTSERVGS